MFSSEVPSTVGGGSRALPTLGPGEMGAGKARRDPRLCWTSLQGLRAASPELPPLPTAEQPAQPFPARQRCGAALRLGKCGIPWDTWGPAWSLIPSPGNLLLAPSSSGMIHALSLAPGDALLPWAGADPQQGHPQVSGLGTPLCHHPRPRRGGEGAGEARLTPGRWARPALLRERAQGRRNLGFACSSKEPAAPTGGTGTGSVRGHSGPAGGCSGWAVQSRACVHPSARGSLVISLVGKIFKESQCQTGIPARLQLHGAWGVFIWHDASRARIGHARAWG